MASRILRLPAVIQLTGLSRSTIYLRIAEGSFPKQVSLAREQSDGGKSISKTGSKGSAERHEGACSYRFSTNPDLTRMLVFFACGNCAGMCERLKQAVLKTAL